MTSPYPAAHRRPSHAGWFAAHGRVLAAVLCGACALVLAVVILRPASVESSLPRVESSLPRVESSLPRVEPVSVRLPAAEVLRAWDRRRARAYARGSVTALRSLYVPGSRAGTADVAMLRQYLQQGLHVTGMRMQLLRVEVVAHAPHRWVIRVTDRLHGAAAVGQRTRIPLPRDEATTRSVTLRREGPRGPWRVASVR